MEALKNLELLIREPLFLFFSWVAIVYIVARVFLDRRLAFTVASVASSYLWFKHKDTNTLVQAWLVIGGFFLINYLIKQLFNLNVVLFLKGKKRCPMCCEEAYRRAKVCPHCGYKFVSEADACE